MEQSHVTTQTKFNYAWGLVKSPVREHQAEGVQLLAGGGFPRRIRIFARSHSRRPRHLPLRAHEKTRMLVLSGIGTLQDE
jgi:fission 1 protein